MFLLNELDSVGTFYRMCQNIFRRSLAKFTDERLVEPRIRIEPIAVCGINDLTAACNVEGRMEQSAPLDVPGDGNAYQTLENPFLVVLGFSRQIR